MADYPVIQFKRGNLANLPGLQAGEPAFTTDTFDLFVGLTSETSTNKFFGSHRYWTKESSSTGSGVNLVEGTSNGSSYISLMSPAALAGIVTYYFPGTINSGGFLKTNGSGELSWSTEISNPTFSNVQSTNTNLLGITTVGASSTESLDVNANSDFSGIATFSNVNDNTLGNADTGAVQIDGGLGVNKNATIGGNLWVEGFSNFVGVVTFQGGTINLGDSTGDNINVGGEFTSGLFPNTTATYDLGDGSRQWRNASLSGILTASDGAVIDGVRIGLDGSTTINTSSGDLILDSATDYVQVSAGLTVTQSAIIQGSLRVDGNTTLGSDSSDTLTINAATNFTGTLTGTASTATRATLVDTTGTTNNAYYYLTFVDTSAGEQSETIRVSAAASLNPSNGDLDLAGNLRLNGNNIKSSTGETVVTLSTDDATFASDLTVQGNLYVNGNTTQVNTQELTILDRTINLGYQVGSASTSTTWDLGVLMNYGDAGVAKTSGVIWEYGVERFVFSANSTNPASSNDLTPQITVSEYAPIEIGALWVNDCAGQSQVISCTSGVRYLKNITIDAGTF